MIWLSPIAIEPDKVSSLFSVPEIDEYMRLTKI